MYETNWLCESRSVWDRLGFVTNCALDMNFPFPRQVDFVLKLLSVLDLD